MNRQRKGFGKPPDSMTPDTETLSGGPTYWWPAPPERPTLNTRSEAP